MEYENCIYLFRFFDFSSIHFRFLCDIFLFFINAYEITPRYTAPYKLKGDDLWAAHYSFLHASNCSWVTETSWYGKRAPSFITSLLQDIICQMYGITRDSIGQSESMKHDLGLWKRRVGFTGHSVILEIKIDQMIGNPKKCGCILSPLEEVTFTSDIYILALP